MKKAKVVLSWLVLFLTISLIIAANPDVSTSTGTTIYTVNEDTWNLYNITVNNTGAVNIGNITHVNITIPSTFVLDATSNTTNSTSTFSNTTTVLSWTNTTAASFVINGTKKRWFAFNATAATPGTYNITITYKNVTGIFNTQNNITVTVNNVNNPTYTTSAIANNTITNDTSQTFSCNATYPNTIAITALNLTFWNYSSGAIYASNKTTIIGQTNSTNWTHTLSVDGNYTWNCLANDTFNNKDWATGNRTIVIDSVVPTAPLYSCDDSSPTIGAQITCTCSGSTDATSGINTSYGSSGYSYTIHPATDVYGTFSLTCRVRDNAGNVNTATTSYTIASGGSFSSGGGSSSTWKSTVILNNNQFEEGYTKSLATKQRMKFSVGGKTHHVGVKEITTSTVKIEVASAPQEATLSVGDERKFDVTDDDYYDLYVKLNSINDGKADLTIKSINEKIIVDTIEEEEEEDAAAIAEGEKVGSNNLWIWIIVIIVILIIAGGSYGLKKKKE